MFDYRTEGQKMMRIPWKCGQFSYFHSKIGQSKVADVEVTALRRVVKVVVNDYPL